MSAVSQPLEIITAENVSHNLLVESNGTSSMILLNEEDGTFIIGTTTIEGERIFSLEPTQISTDDNDANAEYSRPNVDRSSLELDSDPLFKKPCCFNQQEKSIESLINDISNSLSSGFNKINNRIQTFGKCLKDLEGKVNVMITQAQDNEIIHRVAFPFSEKKSGSLIVGVDSTNCALNLDVQPVTTKQRKKKGKHSGKILPEENSYPDGYWLGNPKNPDKRVRVHIKEADLKQLRLSCTSPEKMALSLLDYLFDRETQANSNLSGTSKHGKKQLDPVKIFGIRCHLEYLYNITNKDWLRIKQNIDSKCRTAFRRKVKGMPLKVKSFHPNMPMSRANEDGEALKAISVKMEKPISINEEDICMSSGKAEMQMAQELISVDKIALYPTNVVPIAVQTVDGLTFLPAETIEQDSQMIQVHTQDGRIQIIHATAEQLSQFQLAGAQILEQIESNLEEDMAAS